MKSSNFVMALLFVAALVFALGYNHGNANARITVVPAKVGVVNVNSILQNSKKHKTWQEKMGVEESQIQAEMDKLKSELEFINKDMATLKKGSPEHIKLLREVAEKDGIYQAKQQYYEQEMTMKVKAWTESLYQDIQTKIAEVAKANGLDVVLGAEDVELPGANMRELLLDIKTNKVLYHAEGLDITTEVLAALDAGS
ncbi:MAG: OmpH family outer membrane protein [Sedimentisphaerales bacterium]|nr:OmpH family outer membrane protein [Sedimentisphaerales bacterium]